MLGVDVNLESSNQASEADPDTEMASQAGTDAASGDERMSEDGEDGSGHDDVDGDDDDGGGYSDDGCDEEDDDDDRYLMIEVGTRMSKWEKVEKAREAGSSGEQAHSASQKEVMERQIFNPREAFTMLSRELIDIFKAQSPDLFADAVDYNVYCWDIHVGGFDPKTDFGKVSPSHMGAHRGSGHRAAYCLSFMA
jgi:hypothetical protein